MACTACTTLYIDGAVQVAYTMLCEHELNSGPCGSRSLALRLVPIYAFAFTPLGFWYIPESHQGVEECLTHEVMLCPYMARQLS